MRRSPGPPTAVQQLERALRGRKVDLHAETRAQTAVLDAVYRLPCGVLGIHECETWEELEGKWREAQRELGSLVRAHRLAWGLGNDAYLLFLLHRAALGSVSQEQRVALLKVIEASPMECLKEVVPLTDEWQEALDDLTFMPLATPLPVADRASTAVDELLQQIGLPSGLSRDLTRRRGPRAETVVQRFRDGRYGGMPTVAAPASTVLSAELSTDVKSSPQTAVHLGQLTLTNFRCFCGVGNATPAKVDLSGNLILVYGENGTGKTCLAQAIEWAVCGDVGSLSDAVARESIDDYVGTPVRSIWMEDRPATVQLGLSDGQVLSCVEGRDGTRQFRNTSRQEADILQALLGVGKEPYERIESLRDRASANLVLLQGQMSRLLSARPDERLSQFATLLGESGLPRTEGRLTDIGRELRRQLGQLDQEKAAIAAREEAARDERASIMAELATGTDQVESALTPEQYLDRCRDYHAVASVSIPEASDQPSSDEATRTAVHQIVEHLEQRRAVLVSAVDRARRFEERSKQLVSARAELAQNQQAVGEARRDYEEIAAQVAAVQQELARLDGEIGSLRVRHQRCSERRSAIERWFELKPLIQRRQERLSEVVQRLAILQSGMEDLDREMNARSVALASAQDGLVAASRARDEVRQRAHKLQEVVALQRQHGRLDEHLKRLDSERREAAASAEAAEEELRAIRQRRDSATALVSATESELNQLRSKRESRDRLLQSLREHIETEECPLCSHRYGTREQLLASVERRIGAPSVGEQSLITRLQQERASLGECERLMAECQNRLETARRKATEAADGVGRVVELANALRGMLSAVGLSEDASVERVSSELERWRRDLDGIEREVAEAECKVAVEEKALEEATNRRRGAWEELGKLANEERDLTQQVNEASSEASASLGALPESDQEIARELERMRAEEQSCVEQLQQVGSLRVSVATDLESARQKLSACETEVQHADERAAGSSSAVAKLESDLRVLGPAEAVATLGAIEQELSQIEQLARDGQSVLQALDTLAARGRLADAEARLRDLSDDRGRIEQATQRLRQWQEVLAEAAGILQQEKARVVSEGLEPIGGFMRRLHRRLARHPLFDDVKWEVRENAIHFWAESRSGIVRGRRLVQAYTNEAQQNIVALCVFLAAALCRGGRLRTVVLDDPIQAMDEVNIYGLLDLLRQVSTHAQVIMTTGRNDLFHLARAKFACLNDGGDRHFRAYRLKWGGPRIGTIVEEVT